MNKTIFIVILFTSTFQCYHSLGQKLKSKNKKDASFISMNDSLQSIFNKSFSLQNDKLQSVFRYGFEFLFPTGLVIGYEKSIGNGFTILPELGLKIVSFSWSSYDGNFSFPLHITGQVFIRKYYNINSRISKKKNTRNNAFSYVGVLPLFFSKPVLHFGQLNYDKKYSSIIVPICWGVQRNIGKMVLFDFLVGVGPGYILSSIDDRNIGFTAGFHLKVAFLFHN